MALLQLLERGHTVAAAARAPQKSSELQALAKQYPSTLKLITMDVLDTTSVAVGILHVPQGLHIACKLVNPMACTMWRMRRPLPRRLAR